MGSQLPLEWAQPPPQFSVHVCCGQTAGWIKMPLGTEVDLGPSHIVLIGDSPPAKVAQQSPRFSAHVMCGHSRPSQLLLRFCNSSCDVACMKWLKSSNHATQQWAFSKPATFVGKQYNFDQLYECCISSYNVVTFYRGAWQIHNLLRQISSVFRWPWATFKVMHLL